VNAVPVLIKQGGALLSVLPGFDASEFSRLFIENNRFDPSLGQDFQYFATPLSN
jgi:hypothetical protein